MSATSWSILKRVTLTNCSLRNYKSEFAFIKHVFNYVEMYRVTLVATICI